METPLMKCPVGAGGLLRWRASQRESEFLEIKDGVIARRVRVILVTMEYDRDHPERLGADVVFKRREDCTLGFDVRNVEVSYLVRTAILYTDQNGRSCAEGDLELIANEVGGLVEMTEAEVLPDARGLDLVFKRRNRC